MPTYNFTSDGAVFVYTYLSRSIDGPANFTPREDAEYFTMSYLGGSDLYYWPTNTFQIDGVEFEGTLEEFCDTAEALFATSGGGGGEAWPDIDANTIVQIAATKSFAITDDESNGLISASNEATTKSAGLGDPAGLITEGPTSSVAVIRNISGDTAYTLLDANYDSYTSDAYVSVRANSAASAEVLIGAYGTGFDVGASFKETGIKITGLTNYADNAAAIAGGLVTTNLYHTDGFLKIVI